MFLVAACSASGNGLSGIAAYADGRWSCAFTTAIGPDTPIIEFAVNVVAESSTRGRVKLAVVLPKGFTGKGPPDQRGEWQVRNGKLGVQWKTTSLGPTDARPISMQTKRFRIRGGTAKPPRAGEWVDVRVDLGTRTATFDFTLPEDKVPGTLTCRQR